MSETDPDDVLAWVAGQLTWERQLRELEAAAESPADHQVEAGWTLPEQAPMVPAWPARRATPRWPRRRRRPA